MVSLVGIDIGTTGTKVTIYNEDGLKIDSAYCEYSLTYPKPYWVEFEPTIWFNAVSHLFKEIFSRNKVSPEEIRGVGVSSTNALVLMNNKGIPVRPAIMQLDQRSSYLVEQIKGDLGEGYINDITQNRLASGAYWGPTLLWLKLQRELELQSVKRFLTPHSYIIYKLTNEYCIDHSRASTTMLYDANMGKWDQKLCSYFGVEMELLPTIYNPVDIIGEISKEASFKTGLNEGTPVIAGCMDSLAGHIGIGAKDNTASLILGSVGRICYNTNKCDLRFMNIKNTIQSSMFSMTPTNSTGISYKWVKSLLFDDTSNQSEIYKMMDELGRKSSIGANGLIYHPYISGERSPIWDPLATGSFSGITVEHKREDMIRSVLEGVGYSLAHNYKIIKEELGYKFECIHASGGGAKSNTWLQILADILQVPIKVPSNSDSETLGMAILVGAAIGVYQSVDEGMERTVKFKEQYEPNGSNSRIYQDYLELYIEIYENNKNLYKKLRNIKNK